MAVPWVHKTTESRLCKFCPFPTTFEYPYSAGSKCSGCGRDLAEVDPGRGSREARDAAARVFALNAARAHQERSATIPTVATEASLSQKLDHGNVDPNIAEAVQALVEEVKALKEEVRALREETQASTKENKEYVYKATKRILHEVDAVRAELPARKEGNTDQA
ncbi:uncharacterized protein AB675_4890 [Cyphellophora attinorum]|uniref:Uncharacterized protein n=1 Tax=Cyphellophora attinorum TaxID=1664694 RepID=A0A0N0NH79_9EURO|nr:uncharacterized protein AB675_4890 [Phialophora attinorum]KPI34371.1 hypothetical protein AB675_4890 [Phialophora attinorum]